MNLNLTLISVPENYCRKAMKGDQIVKEVRQCREQHATRFSYNLQAIYQDLKRQEHRIK
jgi:hypothetical protein